MPKANIRPPLGPPVSSNLIFTFTGKLCFVSIFTPMKALPSSRLDSFTGISIGVDPADDLITFTLTISPAFLESK